MVNLLRAEFYKLRKCTAFQITCVLTVLFTAIAYLFRMLVENQMIGNAQVQQLERMAENNIFYMLHQMYAKSNTILFATVFICIFVITDYSSGAGKIFGRRIRGGRHLPADSPCGFNRSRNCLGPRPACLACSCRGCFLSFYAHRVPDRLYGDYYDGV